MEVIFKISDCSDKQITDYRFVRYEFDITLLIVYLGVLRSVNRHKLVAYFLDLLSSGYLLWATYTRQFYLHNTSVGQWANDLCSAAVSNKDLIYNYLAVSVASWVASSFLECNSVIQFKKLYSAKLWRCLRWKVWSRLSRLRWLVLTLTLFCTVNSLLLTLVLWSTVHHSFENVSKDRSILAFLTIAALMRLLRQFIEGLVFIAGIVTRDFRWRNSKKEKLMGRVTFSSFTLLIHSSVLTYTFCTTNVWSVDQQIVFSALLADIIFQIVVCSWAAVNSCCYVRAKRNLTFYCVRSAGKALLCYCSTTTNTLYSAAVSAVNLVYSCTLSVKGFLYRTILMVAFGAIRQAYTCVACVLTRFVVMCQNYVLHWRIEFVEPFPETQRHTDSIQGEVVFPSYSMHNRYAYDPHHVQCTVLADAILKSQYTTHSPSVILPFPSSASNAPSSSNSLPQQEPLSQQEARESSNHLCSCTFECSPQPQSIPPYLSSQPPPVSSPQPHPVQHTVAPSLPNTRLYGQCSEMVVGFS